MVDDDDFDVLNKFKWCPWKNNRGRHIYYVYRCGDKKNSITMHHQLMNTPVKMHTDHINGNGLDNQRTNLRIVSPKENSKNSHGSVWKLRFPGMFWRRHERIYDLVHKYAHSEYCFG